MKNFRPFQTIKNVHKRFLYVITALLLAVLTPLPAVASPTFTSQPLSTSYAGFGGMTTTADGSWWYIGSKLGVYAYIVNLTTSGTTIDYNIRTLSSDSNLILKNLTTGPDGNIWFNGLSSNSVRTGVLDISTGTVTTYGGGGSSYGSIGPMTIGADGNLWYSTRDPGSQNYTYLVKIIPSTGAITRTLISQDPNASLTASIASGPDGALWLTDDYIYNNKVRSIDIGFGGGSNYTMLNASPSNRPDNIVAGPDGNMWITTSEGRLLKLTADGVFTEYITSIGQVSHLTTGSDGAVWFTDGSKIGRITTSGSITHYTVPGSNIVGPISISHGPDDAIWFIYADSGGAKMGKLTVVPDFSNEPITSGFANPQSITTVDGSLWYLERESANFNYTHIGNRSATGVLTDYNLASLSGYAGFKAGSLTRGPDGNVWFVGLVGSSVYAGYLDISTGTVTTYPSSENSYNAPKYITAGSDGNIYYIIKSASSSRYRLMKVNISSGTTTVAFTYDITANITGLTSGSDGNLWMTETSFNRVYKYSVSGGGMSGHPVPTPNSWPTNIMSGPDGNLWFIEVNTKKIAKLTTSGSFTEYPVSPTAYPNYITAGPDGAVWFSDDASPRKLTRMSVSGVTTDYVIPGSSVGYVTSMTIGPDDAIWFNYSGQLGRLGY